MLKTRLFCIMCISLCALYSSRAQDWESMAVELERTVWNGASIEETNDALIRKAACYGRLGRYADASATLGRVRMFALEPEEQGRVLYGQELYWFMSGDFGQAATLIEEVGDGSREALLLHALVLAYAGRYDESEIYAARFVSWDGPCPRLGELLKFYECHPRPRKASAAMALAFVPPLGHFYNGAYGEGLLSLGLNGGAAAFVVANLLGGYWVTGIVGGGILLNYTFMGNQERNTALVRQHNAQDPLAFGDALRNLLQDITSDIGIDKILVK